MLEQKQDEVVSYAVNVVVSYFLMLVEAFCTLVCLAISINYPGF